MHSAIRAREIFVALFDRFTFFMHPGRFCAFWRLARLVIDVNPGMAGPNGGSQQGVGH
jgi:hypothetical protein